MRALSVGGKGGVTGGVWESRELCWWPPAFSDVAASNVSVRVCVCVSTADVIELFIDFHFNQKSKKREELWQAEEEDLLGLGRRAGRPTDVIQDGKRVS